MDCPSKVRAIEATSATLAAVAVIWLWGHVGTEKWGRPGSALLPKISLESVAQAHTKGAKARFEELELAATGGDPDAQFALARALRSATSGAPQDVAAARSWLERAAAGRHAGAAYILGTMHLNGEGGPSSPDGAMVWFKRAAALGSAQSMFMLGNLARARGDHRTAIDFYNRAAEREHPAALQALSLAYEHGELGLVPDDAEARRFAMEAGHALSHPPSLPDPSLGSP
jgi:uncharacterized protein